ncbi:MAG: flagellar protein FlaG [Proteobacteria bacterium]|nr:flagellar protein FlaG [Pseudomonadota bacterium]
MDSKVATFAATPDPTYGQKARQQTRPDTTGASAQPAPSSQDQADMRLVIEEDKASNSYVYKTIDRLTGEVIQQLPRDQVLKLREQLEYEAGTVVRTKA